MIDRASSSLTPWQRLAEQVIDEHCRLSPSKWWPHFRRLKRSVADHHSALEKMGAPPSDNAPDPRELLIWAWCVLMSAPESTSQAYLTLSEDRLAEEAATLRARGYAMRGLETSPVMQMCWLGALVRAIDADLAAIDYWPRRRSEFRSSAWCVEGYPCYVVPVRRDYRCEDGKERRRRATRYHAIVPTTLGELEVELVLHPDVAAAAAERSWTYGAAVFEGMTIDIDRVGEDGFIVSGAPCPTADEAIQAQIAAALAQRCDAVVWPELSVPGDRLETIRDSLGARDPLADPRRLPLVLAGSWHGRAGGNVVNRATLLHGKGQTLLHYDKRRQFPFQGRLEAITAGTKVPVIVMEDRLASIAICRDFCDACDEDIYDELGVDLVLVPSMGSESTLDAQKASAKNLQSQQGAVTFLVQQVPVLTGEARPPGEPVGYSFALPSPRASGARAADARQETPFRPLRARR